MVVVVVVVVVMVEDGCEGGWFQREWEAEAYHYRYLGTYFLGSNYPVGSYSVAYKASSYRGEAFKDAASFRSIGGTPPGWWGVSMVCHGDCIIAYSALLSDVF